MKNVSSFQQVITHIINSRKTLYSSNILLPQATSCSTYMVQPVITTVHVQFQWLNVIETKTHNIFWLTALKNCQVQGKILIIWILTL